MLGRASGAPSWSVKRAKKSVNDRGAKPKTPSQLDAEIAEALAGPPRHKNTVTILTVTHSPRDSSPPPPAQLFVFAHRERALDALAPHLTNPEVDTTVTIRTLEIIR